MFYTILNVDTGIGIISKKQLKFLSNTLDRNKQEQLSLKIQKNITLALLIILNLIQKTL